MQWADVQRLNYQIGLIMNKIQIYNNGEAYWVVLNNENGGKEIIVCRDYDDSIDDHAWAIKCALEVVGHPVEFIREAYNEDE